MIDRSSSTGADVSGLQLTCERWQDGASWSGPAAPATVGQARHAVAELAAARGISGNRLDDLRMCVSEAVSNAVLHAFGDGRPDGIISISVEFSRDALTLVIRDNGNGLHKRRDSPGLGLGLPIIGALSDAMAIVTAVDGGTELSITFTL
jgi:serine/threonine-protein kinase RsbW/stage II sporulation protein AB (anti-sigma F factor)